jgi:hypothetical protein
VTIPDGGACADPVRADGVDPLKFQLAGQPNESFVQTANGLNLVVSVRERLSLLVVGMGTFCILPLCSTTSSGWKPLLL